MLTLSCHACIHENTASEILPCSLCIRNGARIEDHYVCKSSVSDISTEDLYAELDKRIKGGKHNGTE